MSTATLTKSPLSTKLAAYAPYWEDDQTMNPTMVRITSHYGESEFYGIRLPDGTHKEVHLHTLGKFRVVRVVA